MKSSNQALMIISLITISAHLDTVQQVLSDCIPHRVPRACHANVSVINSISAYSRKPACIEQIATMGIEYFCNSDQVVFLCSTMSHTAKCKQECEQREVWLFLFVGISKNIRNNLAHLMDLTL